MKVMNVGAPLVLGYYMTKEFVELLENKIRDGFGQEVVQDSVNYLFITIDYDSDIEKNLRLFLSKSEKVTTGNKYKYEVELDYDEIKDDKTFIINTDDNKFYKCALSASEVNGTTLILKFKII